jgi:hypothetical protein
MGQTGTENQRTDNALARRKGQNKITLDTEILLGNLRFKQLEPIKNPRMKLGILEG